MRTSKQLKAALESFDRTQLYPLSEAVQIVKDNAKSKFDETVDLAVNLGVDPRRADQQVRGTVQLPHGTGKQLRVAVFAEGPNATAAEEAGADVVGAADLAEKIQGGWLEFDIALATPDMMRYVGRLGKVLGPRGLMPNPKAGTVTDDIADAVQEFKAGKIEYRVDKQSGIHVPIGKASFTPEQLLGNIKALLTALVRARPSAAKGQYLKSVSISSTMGAGVKLDLTQFREL